MSDADTIQRCHIWCELKYISNLPGFNDSGILLINTVKPIKYMIKNDIP